MQQLFADSVYRCVSFTVKKSPEILLKHNQPLSDVVLKLSFLDLLIIHVSMIHVHKGIVRYNEYYMHVNMKLK